MPGPRVRSVHGNALQLSDRCLQRPVHGASRDPADVARGIRAAAGGRGAARGARSRRGGGVPDPAHRPGDAGRQAAARRSGAAARSDQRLGPGPLLVAGSDGPLRPAARGADDADLAQLVRDLDRGVERAADDRAERDDAGTGARQLPRSAGGGHARPGDAAVAVRHLEHQVQPERELRPRGDGAVHARRRPRRLHPARRPRAGASADRLHEPVERRRAIRFPLRPDPARLRRQDDLRPPGPLGAGATPAACAFSTRCIRRSWSRSCGTTSSARRFRPGSSGRSSARTSSSGYRGPAADGGDPAPSAVPTRDRGW